MNLRQGAPARFNGSPKTRATSRVQAMGLKAIGEREFRDVLKRHFTPGRWKALSWPKKAFVWFCAAAGFAAVLLALTVVSNLSLSPFLDVMKTGGEFVTIEGTSARSPGLNGSFLTIALQTSRIECYRSQRRCTEARAAVLDNTLSADLVEYEVDSWTAASIVLRNDAPCASEVYTIDLNTTATSDFNKAAIGAGHLINKADPFCKRFARSADEWTIVYRMAFISTGSEADKRDHCRFGLFPRSSVIDCRGREPLAHAIALRRRHSDNPDSCLSIGYNPLRRVLYLS
jgi:hypothetical protein